MEPRLLFFLYVFLFYARGCAEIISQLANQLQLEYDFVIVGGEK